MLPKTYKKKSYKKAYKPKRKSTRRFKKSSTWNPQRVTSVTIQGLSRPDRLNVKLPYEEILSLGGATNVDYVMNLNSLYDPNRTGFGHQPMGYDTWSPIYNRYLVHGCKVDVEFINNSATSISIVGMVANNDTAGLAASAVLEQSRGKNTMLTTATGSKNSTKMQAYFACNNITGVTKSKYNSDDSYQAVINTSPTESVCLHLFSQDAGLATNVTTLVRIRMTYYATFFDPNPLVQS